MTAARQREARRPAGDPREQDGPAGPSAQRSVALLIEMSNAHSRGILHGIRRYIRTHERWMIRFSEQGRGSRVPRWLGPWRGDGVIARITDGRIADAVARKHLPVVD